MKPHVWVKTSTGRDVWVVLSLHNEWNVLVEGINASLLIIYLLKMLLVGTRSGLISSAVVLVLLFWSQINFLCRKAVTRVRLEGRLEKSSAEQNQQISVNLLNQQEVVMKSTVCIYSKQQAWLAVKTSHDTSCVNTDGRFIPSGILLLIFI